MVWNKTNKKAQISLVYVKTLRL